MAYRAVVLDLDGTPVSVGLRVEYVGEEERPVLLVGTEFRGHSTRNRIYLLGDDWELVEEPLEAPPVGGASGGDSSGACSSSSLAGFPAAAAAAAAAPRASVAPAARAAAASGAGPRPSQAPAAAADPTEVESSPSEEVAAPAAAALPAARAPQGGRLRYYVVTAGPAGLPGIYRCTWEQLKARLPGQRFPGGGVHLWGYDDLADAQARWYQECDTEPPPTR